MIHSESYRMEVAATQVQNLRRVGHDRCVVTSQNLPFVFEPVPAARRNDIEALVDQDVTRLLKCVRVLRRRHETDGCVTVKLLGRLARYVFYRRVRPRLNVENVL